MMTPEFGALRASVMSILEHAHDFEWTSQGFGFIRAYYGDNKKWRLNVWHSSLRVPNVSTIHDHPWDFTSFIIGGEIGNTKYEVGMKAPDTTLYRSQTIKTGVGGGPMKNYAPYYLRRKETKVYRAGEYYKQSHDEIHETTYTNGAVSLNVRRVAGDGDHAMVFWPDETEWVDAIPKPATDYAVAYITNVALETMLKDEECSGQL